MTRAALFRKTCALIASDRRGTRRDDVYHVLFALGCNAEARALAAAANEAVNNSNEKEKAK